MEVVYWMVKNILDLSSKQNIMMEEQIFHKDDLYDEKISSTTQKTSDTISISNNNYTAWSENIKMNGDRLGAYEMFSGDENPTWAIRDLFAEYYAGNKSAEDVKNEFDSLVKKVWELDQNMGVVEDDCEHYGKVVSSVFKRFKMMSVQEAFSANLFEGKKLADQYGTPGKRNFMYYNSDYYFQSESMNDILTRHASEMLEEFGAEGKLDTKMINPTHENFNTFMKHWMRYECCMGDIIDTTMEPPQGFKFLYKENRYTQADIDAMGEKAIKSNTKSIDGLLKILYGNRTVGESVNLRYDISEANGFNVLELLGRIENVGWTDEVFNQFLKNINIHRTCYNGVYLGEVGSFRQYMMNK